MRVYSEQEVSQILERAVERQAKATPAVPEAGLTLADLERVAADVGIDAAHLRAAAAEVDATGGASRRRSQTAAHVHVERWVPGSLTDEAWDDLVAELQNRFGKAGLAALTPGAAPSGTVAVVGRNREWVHTDGLGVETRVLASGRGDRVRLRLSQRVGMGTPVFDGSVVGLGLGWIPGVVLAAFFVQAERGVSAGWAIPLVLLSMLLVGLFTFVHDRRWRARMHDRLDALGADLADVLAAHAGPVAAPVADPATPVGAPALPLALGTEATPDPTEAAAPRRVRS